jgi:hypothetical protein
MATLSWWCPESRFRDRDAIICDGAVRSGKTLCLSIGFAVWAMTAFRGQCFALCGKTVTSLRRNLVLPLLGHLRALGFCCEECVSHGYLDVSLGCRHNRFYLFGGRDESSAALIQGVTLAGVLLDEVALMPRSFVEQALARCSVEGAKFWFNCNPAPLPLVLHRMDSKSRAEKRALPAFYHAGQPLPFLKGDRTL